ncbi:biopolymer transporter ExbD [Romeria aff. gracilis LEGE 07310]|uniref:Biopolymer transporter ExbD n=2 Tax=Vasconcelosia TaxID=3366328 RepID=A0A8J7AA44_9CYAN|nr:biopolymer transporter ExbD [Romeria aff. gracilis LEGE 07310]
MRLPDETEDPRLSINILPMIDVMFAILAFFILSSLFLTRAQGLPVDLPQAATSARQEQVDLTLTLTAAGDLYLNEKSVDLDKLPAEVKALLAPGQPALVTIRADQQTSHGQVVTVMDQLRTVEGLRLGISTQP